MLQIRTGLRGWSPYGPQYLWSRALDYSAAVQDTGRRQPICASRRMGTARPQRAGETENGTERLAKSAENRSYSTAFSSPLFKLRRLLLSARLTNGRCSRPYLGRSERKGRGTRSRYAALPIGSAARGADGPAATVPGRRHRWLRRRSSYL